MYKKTQSIPVADLRGCEGRMPLGSHFFQFHVVFLGKFGKIVCWRPQGVGTNTSGKSWIRHWCLLRNVPMWTAACQVWSSQPQKGVCHPIIWPIFAENCMNMKELREGPQWRHHCRFLARAQPVFWRHGYVHVCDFRCRHSGCFLGSSLPHVY